MATATRIPNNLNDATGQIVQANERFVEAGKRAGKLYLDGYDQLVEGVTSFQEKLVEQPQNDAVRSVVATHVNVTRQLASAYTSAARKLLA